MYLNIITLLELHNIAFEEINHAESFSCDDSKKYREEAGLSGIGSKNIIFHAKGQYYFVTTIGEKDIKARKFKKEFATKDIRFANQEEITNLINGIIGCIAPFGFNNNTLKIFVDLEIFEHEYFMFNPGISTKTIRIKTSDLKFIYKTLENEITLLILEKIILNLFL